MLAVFRSEATDPVYHLAFEEYLLRRGTFEEWALFVYRNAPCIVVGRNQNPWIECRTSQAARRGAPVLRRVSAGGTVYHDPGNLNVTLIGPRRGYEPGRHVRIIADVLRGMGIPARIDSRHSILVNGAKVSGSAFMLTGARALQHATLLVAADLKRLHRLLQPGIDPEAVTSHIRRSHAQPVINLRDILPGIDIETIEQAVVEHARTVFGATPSTPEVRLPQDTPENDPDWARLRARYASPEWRWGRTPRFEWRVCGIRMIVEAGRIREVFSGSPADGAGEGDARGRGSGRIRGLTGAWFDPEVVRGLFSFQSAGNFPLE